MKLRLKLELLITRLNQNEIELVEYTWIPSPRGKKLLMRQGFTYYQINTSRHYYCSKASSRCKARLKLALVDGKIEKIEGEHNHEPPQYVVTASGAYVKIAS